MPIRVFPHPVLLRASICRAIWGRNTVIGPGLFNIDHSILKDTKISRISESFKIIPADFFNRLNRANFSALVDSLQPFDGSGAPIGSFGQLDSVGSAREIQLAIKILL